MVPDTVGSRTSIVRFLVFFFFFHDTATTEIYTLSLHDALPISTATATKVRAVRGFTAVRPRKRAKARGAVVVGGTGRSEEHTSELQSRPHLVCRLLLEKKK